MSGLPTLDSIRKRVEDNHPGDVSFGHEDVQYLLAIIDGVREYIEEIQTPYNDEQALDRLYEMVGGTP